HAAFSSSARQVTGARASARVPLVDEVDAAHQLRHEPGIAVIEREGRKRPVIEDRAAFLGAEELERHLAPEMRPHGHACEAVTERVMDALMHAHMRKEIESRGTASGPAVAELNVLEIGKYPRELATEPCRGGLGGGQPASRAPAEEKTRPIGRAADEVYVVVGVEKGAVLRQNAPKLFRRERLRGDHEGIEGQDAASEPSDGR